MPKSARRVTETRSIPEPRCSSRLVSYLAPDGGSFRLGLEAKKSIATFLPKMVDEHYRQMAWEVETGIPTWPTLAGLQLDEHAATIERRD